MGYSTPLWYAQRVEGRRPDLVIIDDRTRLDEGLGDITDVIDAHLGRKTAAAAGSTPRVARLSYFFPAHNEEANLAGLVEEALGALPRLAETFEIIAVDDGSRDATASIAEALAEQHPDVVRLVRHPVNLGYGAALRSGFGAARYELIAFTDGDRQFKVADIGRLTERLAAPDAPDVVVGVRIKRADPLIRTLYARAYRLANRIFFGLRVSDVDCACKLFRRDVLDGLRVDSGGAFFSAELLIKLQAAGRRVAEVGVPHYPRTAGSATGAKPKVILRAVRDFWLLRLRMWANSRAALRRGRPILGG
ncbi:MAG: glycosyltransferase family 2 protein [Candidatus Limnocylindrales bacterium]|nr:glycosyltransferase family 2 protein [Candidatus Limnocylindrales bacterium]